MHINIALEFFTARESESGAENIDYISIKEEDIIQRIDNVSASSAAAPMYPQQSISSHANESLQNDCNFFFRISLGTESSRTNWKRD